MNQRSWKGRFPWYDLQYRRLAMVACGEYESVKDCCGALCAVASFVKPEPELVVKYEARYQQFKKIYPAVKALFPEIQ